MRIEMQMAWSLLSKNLFTVSKPPQHHHGINIGHKTYEA
jgi:hypothetical protein